jgi:hypothetical protein
MPDKIHPLAVHNPCPGVIQELIDNFSNVSRIHSAEIYHASTKTLQSVSSQTGFINGSILRVRECILLPGKAIFASGGYLLESFAKMAHINRALSDDEERGSGLTTSALHVHIAHELTVDPGSLSIKGPVASIASLFMNNFGHWHVEALASIELALKCDEESKFIVPTLSKWQKEVLALSGLDDSKLIELPPGQAVRLDQLIVPSPSWLYNAALQMTPVHYLTKGFMAIQRKALLVSSYNGPERIFVRRPEKGNRRLSNFLGLEALLTEHFGFTAVSPENLAYSDQVRLFSTANIIAGCSGAAFTLLAFAQPGSKVLEFSYANGWHSFWNAWASSFANLRHFVYIEPQVSRQEELMPGSSPHPQEWSINLDGVRDFLDICL